MSNGVILVIDDEPQIQKLLEISLESNGYKVIQAATAKEGIALAASHTPDLILLDLGLPDKNGQQLLVELRSWFKHAIIILSVENTENAIVTALDHGATDYLTKPFRTAELLARIRSALRHNLSSNLQPQLHFSDLEIDLQARSVKKSGVLLKLTATEFQLLQLMAVNEGRVLTHQFLLKEIWGVGAQNQTQYLRVFVAALRKKLEDYPNQPKHLLTESGIGYRWV
ncbi:MAG: response regulator [Chitinophagales bacterium]